MSFGAWEILVALACLVAAAAIVGVIVAAAIILSKEGQHRRQMEEAAKAGRPAVGGGEAGRGESNAGGQRPEP